MLFLRVQIPEGAIHVPARNSTQRRAAARKGQPRRLRTVIE